MIGVDLCIEIQISDPVIQAVAVCISLVNRRMHYYILFPGQMQSSYGRGFHLILRM